MDITAQIDKKTGLLSIQKEKEGEFMEQFCCYGTERCGLWCPHLIISATDAKELMITCISNTKYFKLETTETGE